jgi:hypothetical protein
VQLGLRQVAEADDTEHLGGCRLMLQRLAQLGVALLQFLKQPDIFDGDHCLGCEGRNQLDLLIGERTNLCTTNCDRSDSVSFAQERRNHDCTCAGDFVDNLGVRKLSVNFSWKVARE